MPSQDQSIGESNPRPTRLHSWLTKLGLHRPELRAWAMYDWANSAMLTTIVTAVFPIYFARVACDGVFEVETARRWFATITVIAMTIIALLSPVLGTMADLSGRKMRMLGVFLTLGLTSVAAMFFIYRGDWILASVLFVLANIGANGSFVFYDALLTHVARKDEINRVSTAGYALGYIGGGSLLGLNLLWISKPAWFGLPAGDNLSWAQSTLPTRLAFLSVAIWWLAFSIPLFRRVSEPPASNKQTAGKLPIRATFTKLWATGRALGRYRQAFLMLLAFLIYNDGIGTIYRMAGIFGTERNFDTGVIIAAIMIVQFVGIPCAFLFGMLADWIGAKRAIAFGLVVYMAICVLGYFMKTVTHYVILAMLVGAVQGGTQALSRSLFATMIPRDMSGEFFGFFAVAEKFAGILGPLFFTQSSSQTAILALIGFFVVGGLLLTLVNVDEGQRLARADEELRHVPA
jgi:MFS transporter, UMF1 family